jgi:hypothetical protein
MATIPDAEAKCSVALNTTADEPAKCAAVAMTEPATSISPSITTNTECTKPRRSRFGPLFQVWHELSSRQIVSQHAQDVVLGTFFASSHPAKILFDSGASHSFVSLSFVAKHHLPITIMKHAMLVSSPGVEMRTKHICPAVSITIKGVDFLANLIVLDSRGIDIILGMD